MARPNMTQRSPLLFACALAVLLLSIAGAMGGPSASAQEGDVDPAIDLSLLPPAKDQTRDALVQSGKVDAVVAEAVEGGPVDAIVVLRDEPVLVPAEARKAQRGLVEDDAQVLAEKAVGYAILKDVARSVAPSVSVLQDYEHIGTFFARIPDTSSLVALANHPAVLSVVENEAQEAMLGESLPLVQQPAAQLSGFDGSGTAVAVLDTGLDYLRPHFGCTAVNTPSSTCKVPFVQDFAPSDNNVDANGHGTNVSAVVSAVAPGAKVIGLDIFDGASAFSTDTLAAINWVLANKVTYNIVAVNLSIGNTDHLVTCNGSYATSAFANLRSGGVIPVVSAGNLAVLAGVFTNGLATPACTPGALSVGAVYDSNVGNGWTWGTAPNTCLDATTAANQITCFSQTASSLGLLAPGAMANAAAIEQGGTSQAAPHVAGAVAVLAGAKPQSTVAQREAALTGTGPQITDARNGVTKRRLDVCAALANLGSTCNPSASNDNRTNATAITSVPALFRQSTTGFTTEVGDPSPSCAIFSGQQSKSAWFKLTTGTAGTLSANTRNSYYNTAFGTDTVLAVYRQDGVNLVQVACDDDGAPDVNEEDYLSVISVGLTGNATYYIEVTSAGPSAAFGSYLVLNVNYTGSLTGGGPVTSQLTWQATLQNGIVDTNLPVQPSVAARTAGGAINTADNTTQITLQLQPATGPAQGLPVANDDRSPYIDVRDANNPNPAQPTAEQLRAFDDFESSHPVDLRREYSAANGTLSSLTGLGGALRGPDSRAPSEIGRDFLAEIRVAAGFPAGFVEGLTETRNATTPSTGLTSIDYQQTVADLPVFQAYARLGIAADGRVLSYQASLYPEIDPPAGAPALTAEDAIDVVAGIVGPPARPADDSTDESAGSLNASLQPKADLVIFPAPKSSGVLAWQVQFVQAIDGWLAIVDATSGELLFMVNLTAEADPQGLVFEENPGAGTQVTKPFIGALPSPRNAWVGTNFTNTTCTTCTSGNNVFAGAAQIVNADGSFTAFAAFDTNSNFSYPWTNIYETTGNPDGDTDAAVTTLFYFNNLIHDWLYSLGFNEAAGNFQANNFGAGGFGNDEVFAAAQYGFDSCLFPQDKGCRNNATFFTPFDGTRPTMRMFMFDDPPFKRRDGSVDGDIVFHEYGHGLSNRLITPGAVQGIQSGAMGEGWGDYLAATHFNDPVMGEYATGNAIRGIRNFAYDNHPWTYSHLCTTNFGNGPECEVHADGEIWAAALWDMRANLIGQYGLANGTAKSDQLVVDGLKLTPNNPDFLDARDAILQADVATGGANQCLIWQAFADRGMGFSASTSGHNDTSVSDAFDLPVSCQAAAATLTCNQPLTQTVTNGVATWTGCKINQTGSGYKIRAISNALPSVDSNSFNITSAPQPQPGQLSFTQASQDVSESAGTATFMIQRTGGDDGPVSVNCVASGGTAQAGVDFNQVTSNPITWADQDSSSKPCTVSIVDDAQQEADETVLFTLSGATGGATITGTNPATLKILANDAGGNPPAKLAITQVPAGGLTGTPLGSIVVQVQDANGALVPTATNQVTLGLTGVGNLQGAPSGSLTRPQNPVPADRQPIRGKDSLLPEFGRFPATDSWAVWIADGADPATVARRLGATDLGPSVIPGVRLFQFSGRAFFRDPVVTDRLEADPDVTQYEQQVVLQNTARTMPADPSVGSQWHLKNNINPDADINVEPVWDMGYHGEGVVVGIVDDSYQTTHPDLAPGYSAALSKDFVNNDLDPNPVSTADRHGIAVAGLVGARDEGTCGVGVAYRSTMAGIRGGGYSLTDATEGSMLGWQQGAIHIYNNSWGPQDIGVLGPIGTQALASVANGVTSGRGGLGNIWVWAGGNGRSNKDNVNYDGYANLRYVNAIAALERDDTYAPYSEPGAALIASVPGGALPGDITTSDRTGADGYSNGDCTSGFNGTSAASPIAAGIIALMLDANPNLTWRDVQHVLVHSTDKNDPGDGDWAQNGAGLWVNHNYGFGRLNAQKAVQNALSWTNVGPEQVITSGVQNVNTPIPDNNATGVTRTFNVTQDIKVEHVELVLNATHPFRGDLKVTLTSPQGTVSRLSEFSDDGGDNFTNWKFMTTRNWDEMSAGTWTIKVEDTFFGDTGTWQNFTLNIYGTTLGAPPAAGIVCDNNSVNAVGGIATFTNCSIANAGIGYRITASATGLAGAQSSFLDILPVAYDVNCTGQADATDAMAVLRKLVGFTSGSPLPTCTTGDADGLDGVDLKDPLVIRRAIAGLVAWP